MLGPADRLYGESDFCRTWHLPTPPKVPKAGSVTVVLLGLIGQQTCPIGENLWAFVKRKMRGLRPNDADDLKAAIKAIWASITPKESHRVITSTPCCTDAVIHAIRGPTKY